MINWLLNCETSIIEQSQWKIEWSVVTWNTVNVTEKQYNKWDQPGMERQVPHDLLIWKQNNNDNNAIIMLLSLRVE